MSRPKKPEDLKLSCGTWSCWESVDADGNARHSIDFEPEYTPAFDCSMPAESFKPDDVTRLAAWLPGALDWRDREGYGEPTEEGRRRFGGDGRNAEGTACRCEPSCQNPCKGECGCRACSDLWSDALSCDFD